MIIIGKIIYEDCNPVYRYRPCFSCHSGNIQQAVQQRGQKRKDAGGLLHLPHDDLRSPCADPDSDDRLP